MTVTGNLPDPNLANNTSTVTTQIGQSVDLSLVKTAAPNPVKAGQQLTYTLTATNNGPSNATGVTIVDTLPAGTSFLSASGQSSATIAGQTLTLNVGNLAAGASSTITVVVGVASTATGTITNTAMVSGNQPDPNPANNTASVSTQIDVPVVQSSPGSEDRQDGDAQSGERRLEPDLYAGREQQCRSPTATGVTVVDTLPAGFAYFSASGQNSATISGNTLTLDLGTMAAQASETITIVGEVTAAAASTITNTATVSGDEQDADPSEQHVERPTTTVHPSGCADQVYYLGRNCRMATGKNRSRLAFFRPCDNTDMHTLAATFITGFTLAPQVSGSEAACRVQPKPTTVQAPRPTLALGAFFIVSPRRRERGRG